MEQPVNIQMLPHGMMNFPWTKYHTLRRRPEIWEALAEDDMPDPNTIVLPCEMPPHHHLWLAMSGPLALGFFIMQYLGLRYGMTHVGFRAGVPGRVKRQIGQEFIRWCFTDAGLIKILALIPEYNLPARLFVRSLGAVPEGRSTKAFLRHGRRWDMILYGVTKDD